MAQLQTDANNVEQLAKPWLWSVVPRQHTRAQPACAIKSQAGWARVRSHVARPGRVKALRGVTCSRQSLSCHCWNAYSRTKNCSSQGVTTCLAVWAGKLIFGIQTRWIWLVALCRLDKAVLQNWHLFRFFFILYIIYIYLMFSTSANQVCSLPKLLQIRESESITLRKLFNMYLGCAEKHEREASRTPNGTWYRGNLLEFTGILQIIA